MTDDGNFHLGYLEGREWAANWAGDDVLQRLATGAPALDSLVTGTGADAGSGAGGDVLEGVTALLSSQPLRAPDLKDFWANVLPDTDAALLRDLHFLSGFLAGTRCIAQEPL